MSKHRFDGFYWNFSVLNQLLFLGNFSCFESIEIIINNKYIIQCQKGKNNKLEYI